MSSLRCVCFGRSYEISVPLGEGLTWGWLVSEAIRLHALSKQSSARRRIFSNDESYYHVNPFPYVLKGARISTKIGGVGSIDLALEEEITEKLLTSLSRTNFTVYILLEGELGNLPDSMLAKVIEFLAYDGMGASNFAAIGVLSKRFRRITQSDDVWSQMTIRMTWSGCGVDGNELQEWDNYRTECGIPVFNMYRIRWIANATSRLKLFYGSLPSDKDASIMIQDENGHSFRRRDVVMMLGYAGQSSAKILFRSLLNLLPNSAKAYHLSEECNPVLREGKIVQVEPSPENHQHKSQQRDYLFVDPGILIEEIPITVPAKSSDFMQLLASPFSSTSTSTPGLTGNGNTCNGSGTTAAPAAEKKIFRMRRIGDERLSFVQFDHDPRVFRGVSRAEEDRYQAIMTGLRDRAAAFSIVLNYGPNTQAEFAQNLSTIYRDYVSPKNFLMADLNLNRKDQANSWGSSFTTGGSEAGNCHRWSEQSAVTSSVPFLLLLALDFPESIRNHRKSLESAIDEAVEFAKRALEKLIATDSFSSDRPWFVQPYDPMAVQRGAHKQGAYAGVNWLVRAMQKQGIAGSK